MKQVDWIERKERQKQRQKQGEEEGENTSNTSVRIWRLRENPLRCLGY